MLVSCVMPTLTKRQNFWEGAIECFNRQTYPDRQLVIGCEGQQGMEESFFRMMKNRDKIKPIFIDQKGAQFSTGKKRNLVNGQSDGEVIIHWDDDDWSHPNRVGDQIALLVATGKQMVGYHDLLYLRCQDMTLWKYLYQSRPKCYATGTSQCYRRTWWEKNPFKSLGVGEDSKFALDTAKVGELYSVEGAKMVVARAHSENTYVPRFGSAPFLPATREEFPEEFLRENNL